MENCFSYYFYFIRYFSIPRFFISVSFWIYPSFFTSPQEKTQLGPRDASIRGVAETTGTTARKFIDRSKFKRVSARPLVVNHWVSPGEYTALKKKTNIKIDYWIEKRNVCWNILWRMAEYCSTFSVVMFREFLFCFLTRLIETYSLNSRGHRYLPGGG